MPTRTTPDGYDIVVWKLDETAAPFVNSSTSGSAPSHASSDLATLSGTITFQQPSPFAASGTNSAVWFTATNSGSPRNFISGANTIEPQAPLTVSFWFYLRTYNNSGFVHHIVTKQKTIGVWSGGTFGTITMQNTGVGSSAYFWSPVSGLTGTEPTFTIPLNMWCHIGFTYDGATLKNYLNGTLVGSNARTGSIDYTSGSHGPWFIGAIPSGSGNPEESAVSICDIRIANVVRNLDYFKNVFGAGSTNSPTTVPYIYVYKLRAYDMSFSPPVPVYWTSITVDYGALSSVDIPSGDVANLGEIEIMEQIPTI